MLRWYFPIYGQFLHHQNNPVKDNHHELIPNCLYKFVSSQGVTLLLLFYSSDNEYLISAVLGAEQRFLETTKLLDWVESAYEWD